MNALPLYFIAAVAGAFGAALAQAPIQQEPAVPRVAGSEPVHYQLVQTIALGGPDSWDYLTYDPGSHRVYASHGDRLSVVDGISGAKLGEVTGFAGTTHGVLIAQPMRQGFTDDRAAGEAAVFDPLTLRVSRRIAAGKDADAMAYDPSSRHVFVINGDPGTLTVIDARTLRLLSTIEVGGKLEAAVADGAGSLYVNDAGQRQLLRISTRSNQLQARWPMASCESPHGLAMDNVSRRLFVSCVNRVLLVVDADRGNIVATLPIGNGTDAAAYDPVRKLIFSSNGRDGTVSVILQRDRDDYVALDSIVTAPLARTMTLDPQSGRLYLVTADVQAQAPNSATETARRPAIVPGSVRMLFFDPVTSGAAAPPTP